MSWISHAVHVVKDAGGDVADAVHQAGADISDESKRAFESLDSNNQALMEKAADGLAETSKNTGAATDYDACMTIVVAGLTAWAAEEGSHANVLTAAVVAGGGYPAAHLACSRVFPNS